MMLTIELFPAPFGPMIARISPAATARSTSSKAVTPPNDSVTPCSVRAAGAGSVLIASPARPRAQSCASRTASAESTATWRSFMAGFVPDRTRGSFGRDSRSGLLRFQFANQGDDFAGELLDLLLEVQEPKQDQVGAGVFERQDAFGDLPRGSDQV